MSVQMNLRRDKPGGFFIATGFARTVLKATSIQFLNFFRPFPVV